MKQTAIKAAKLAGKIMLENYGNVGKISFKENDRSILTKVDLQCEKAIISIIKEKFPDHNIIGEESPMQNKNSEYTWVIDPIDGTTNYLQNIPFFCVSIALAKNNMPFLGVVYEPIRKELFYAERNKGAYLTDNKIKVSSKTNLNEAVILPGLSSTSHVSVNTLEKAKKLSGKVRGIRITGSAEINLSYVACGRMDVFLHENIKAWDAAAGAIIIEEAGGLVTDFDLNKWDINKKTILATNKLLHEKILKLIK